MWGSSRRFLAGVLAAVLAVILEGGLAMLKKISERAGPPGWTYYQCTSVPSSAGFVQKSLPVQKVGSLSRKWALPRNVWLPKNEAAQIP